jgi:phosphoribosylglycinamide formyltransferase 1
MSGRLQTGVLISGRGSNLRALIAACAEPSFPAEIVLVLSNRENAAGLGHARAAGIATAVVAHGDYATREGFDAAMDRRLREAGVEFLCLAGFMRVLSADFVRSWQGRIINIHPSLLPDFKGTHVHERVLAAGVASSGCTVHHVVPELDSGPIIAQARVPVLPGDSPETLAARVLEQEHLLYPKALAEIARGLKA